MPLMSEEVAHRMRSNVLEYMQIFGKTTYELPLDRWRPPAESEYKINVDGSFVPGQHHDGCGVALRLMEGSLLCARAGRIENINDALLLKL